MLSKVQKLEDAQGKLTEAAKEQEAKHKKEVARYESTILQPQQLLTVKTEAQQTDKKQSKEVSQQI